MSNGEHDPSSVADWLSAHDACALVSQHNGLYDATVSIAKRAFAGPQVLRTLAASFIKEQPTRRGGVENVEFKNYELPKEFWWEQGEAAFDENWLAGDFSTYVGEHHWRAFGVTFERSGIEKMLAPETTGSGRAAICGFGLTKPDEDQHKARTKGKGRPLTHDHPYAAAKAALELVGLPKDKRERLNGPSVGSTMQDHYMKKAGEIPHPDNLDEHGASVLRALREHWQEK